MSAKADFNNWLDRINKTETVDDRIIALNFGLFEAENGYTLYLTGSECFDEEDDTWATNIDFEPKEKYFVLSSSLVKGKEWQEVLTVSKELVTEYLNAVNLSNTIFKHVKAITIGFDDGNLIRIKP
ncbi:hypothetical protein [Pontibacter rugosus]|uniref:Uncharacterized protein n=1 Tax=Pontibacter rugosus TaxID=1745966 RepID=A0ABW3SN24_9BACT